MFKTCLVVAHSMTWDRCFQILIGNTKKLCSFVFLEHDCACLFKYLFKADSAASLILVPSLISRHFENLHLWLPYFLSNLCGKRKMVRSSIDLVC